MPKKFTIAYINADRVERVFSEYALDSPETEAQTFADTRAFLNAANAREFDCVLVAEVRDGDVMQCEQMLQHGGHVLPVIGVAESRDLPAMVDALRRGQSTWSVAQFSG